MSKYSYLLDDRHEDKVTVLTNWNKEHLKHLVRKFEAMGFNSEVSENGENAVFEGKHWAALETLHGQVRFFDCLNGDLAAFLPA